MGAFSICLGNHEILTGFLHLGRGSSTSVNAICKKFGVSISKTSLSKKGCLFSDFILQTNKL
jgi:hypothetical protein